MNAVCVYACVGGCPCVNSDPNLIQELSLINRYFYELILEAGYPEKTDFNNHRVSCSDKDEIPDISLDAWADI